MAGVAVVRNFTTFDEAWPILQEEAINKLIANLEIEGLPSNKYFTPEEYIRFYTVVYDVVCARRSETEVGKLYDQWKRTFEDYISSTVLPSLRGKESENLLRELLRRWKNHKTMTRWLTKFFYYLSRYYIPTNGLFSLVQTSYLTFYDQVYGEYKDHLSNAIISLIGKEREGEQIDEALVKQVLDIFEEIGEDAVQNYVKHIEGTFVNHSKRDLRWIATESYEDYMHKVEQCFEKEKTNVSKFLRHKIQDKVSEVHREIKDRVRDAISSSETNIQIHMYRQDERILEQVQHIFKKIGDDASKIYAIDIEEALVRATALFYSRKALEWIDTKSYEDYMLKVEECLEKEEIRLSEYLTPINKDKILEVVRHELLDIHSDKLEEKKASSRLEYSKL